MVLTLFYYFRNEGFYKTPCVPFLRLSKPLSCRCFVMVGRGLGKPHFPFAGWSLWCPASWQVLGKEISSLRKQTCSFLFASSWNLQRSSDCAPRRWLYILITAVGFHFQSGFFPDYQNQLNCTPLSYPPQPSSVASSEIHALVPVGIFLQATKMLVKAGEALSSESRSQPCGTLAPKSFVPFVSPALRTMAALCGYHLCDIYHTPHFCSNTNFNFKKKSSNCWNAGCDLIFWNRPWLMFHS